MGAGRPANHADWPKGSVQSGERHVGHRHVLARRSPLADFGHLVHVDPDFIEGRLDFGVVEVGRHQGQVEAAILILGMKHEHF